MGTLVTKYGYFSYQNANKKVSTSKVFTASIQGNAILLYSKNARLHLKLSDITTINGTPRPSTLLLCYSEIIDSMHASDGNAPVNTVLPSISGVRIVGQTLTSTSGTWTSDTGIILPYLFQWKRGGINIGGATSSTYTLVQADAGENITCQVTATDSDGSANATSLDAVIFDTILDSMPSPLVAVSSVRLLRGAHYGNPIIRVRRSGDNAEADFGVTADGVLDTAAVVAFCIAGGGTQNGFIRTVYGQSGAGINKVQPTPSLQMQIVSGGSLITLNGKVGVQGASGRLMEFGTTSTFNALHNGTTSLIHFVGALKSASEGIVSNNGGSTAQIGTYVGSNTSHRITISVTNGTAGQPPISVNSSNNVFTANNQIILGIQLDADNATASNRVNAFINAGANILTNTNTFAPSASNASNVMQLPTTGFTGIEQEIIIWGVDMSANRTTLRNKTNSFYGTY